MTNELAQLGKRYYGYVRECRDRDLGVEQRSIDSSRVLRPLRNYIEHNYIDLPVFRWVDQSPYNTVEELRLAALDGCISMQEYTEHNTPTQVDPDTFSLFRAYHDFIHHVLLGLSFSPLDEYRAAMMLLPLYEHDKLVQSWVYANVGLMNSVYAWSPSKWSKLNNRTDCLCVCPVHHSLSPHRLEWGNV